MTFYSASTATTKAAIIPPDDTPTYEAAPWKGTIPVSSPVLGPPILVPVGRMPAPGEAPVGYGVGNETDVVPTILDSVAVDVTVADGVPEARLA